MRASKRHQELTDGVGCCSVPMWQMGMECFCEKPAYGKQEKGQRRYGEYAWDGRWIPGYCGGLACYNHGGPQKPEPAPALDPPTPEFAPDVTLEDAAGRDVGVQPFFDLPDQQQDLAPEIQQLISANMDALVEKPAPADTTPDAALLAEAEHWARLTRGVMEPPEGWFAGKLTSDVEQGCAHVLRLATALRESRAREVAEPYRHALEQRLICSNLPLLTGDADADLMRFVFHEQEVAGYFCGQLEAALQAEREGREQAEASVEQWKLDSRQRSAVCDERTAERDTLRAQLAEANAQLALCAENTAAADLAQEVECLKAELASRDKELARLGPVEWQFREHPTIQLWCSCSEKLAERKRADGTDVQTIRRVLPGETGGGE